MENFCKGKIVVQEKRKIRKKSKKSKPVKKGAPKANKDVSNKIIKINCFACE